MKVNMPIETGNRLAKSGKLIPIVKSIVEEQKPEAVYFYPGDGKRTVLLFLNLQDSSEIIKYGEPWFLALDADIEVTPVMGGEDLQKGAPFLEAEAKKWSSV